MTIKKSVTPQRSKRAEERGKTIARRRSPAQSAANAYVDDVLNRLGGYAKSAKDARRVVDGVAPSLTDALYEARRDGGK
jgi:hypothetical protein